MKKKKILSEQKQSYINYATKDVNVGKSKDTLTYKITALFSAISGLEEEKGKDGAYIKLDEIVDYVFKNNKVQMYTYFFSLMYQWIIYKEWLVDMRNKGVLVQGDTGEEIPLVEGEENANTYILNTYKEYKNRTLYLLKDTDTLVNLIQSKVYYTDYKKELSDNNSSVTANYNLIILLAVFEYLGIQNKTKKNQCQYQYNYLTKYKMANGKYEYHIKEIDSDTEHIIDGKLTIELLDRFFINPFRADEGEVKLIRRPYILFNRVFYEFTKEIHPDYLFSLAEDTDNSHLVKRMNNLKNKYVRDVIKYNEERDENDNQIEIPTLSYINFQGSAIRMYQETSKVIALNVTEEFSQDEIHNRLKLYQLLNPSNKMGHRKWVDVEIVFRAYSKTLNEKKLNE